MRHQPLYDTQFFFSTTPLPCPYLPDRLERRVVTELIGRDANVLHEQLSLAGFRRSHGIVYAPACSGCDACKAVRVLAKEFKPSRSQRRVQNRNQDLRVKIGEPVATQEQYQLFSAYQKDRHGDGDMSKMDYFDYQGLIEDTSVDTALSEFRGADDELVAACLTDHMANGLSAVYSFFDPVLESRSLGTHMILWMIKEARKRGLKYVYLGFWINGCSKMDYKARFQPLETRTKDGWLKLLPEDEDASAVQEVTQETAASYCDVPLNMTFDGMS